MITVFTIIFTASQDHDTGSGDFVQEVVRDAKETIAREVRNREKKSIEEIIGRMRRESGVSEIEIKSGSQRRRASKARARIACFLIQDMGILIAEIGRSLGVGASAIAMAIKRNSLRGNPLGGQRL